VIGWRRADNAGGHFVILANFSNTDYTDYRVGLPVSGNWEEALNSQAPAYGGSGATNPGVLPSEGVGADGFGQSLAIQLPRMGLVVLRKFDGTVDVRPNDIVGGLALAPVMPTPARGAATVRFTLPRDGRATLSVVDIRGRSVATLLDGERTAGVHTVRWSGIDAHGAPAPPGIYFLRLESLGETATRSFPLIR
jgi:hypothetical protein